MDVVNCFVEVNQAAVSYQFADRRPGYVARYFANPSKAEAVLNLQTEQSLEDIVCGSWNWQKNNPK